MDIRRVAIKKRGWRIVEANYIRCRTIFDLNAKQPFGNRRQVFHRAKPSADDATHASTTCVLAVRPATDGGCLCESRSDLSGTNKKPTGTFQSCQIGTDLTGNCKFFACERSQTDGFDNPFLFLAKNAKEIYNFTIKIIRSEERRVGK